MPDSYWLIGADGKEYGPATPADMARWIHEGRVVPTTRVRRGAGAHAEARTFPELAALLDAPAPPPAPPSATALAPASGSAASLPAEFRVWAMMGCAWDLVWPHWLPLAGMFFIYSAIGSVNLIGGYVHLILGGVLMIGIWGALLGMLDGRAPDVGMMFSRFDRFGEGFLAYLVTTILTALGFLCFIVPGVILFVLWIFTYPILGETRLGFWEAMQQSAALTEGYRWRLFLLALACIPILLMGLAAAIVGIFVAMPICLTAFAVAYRWLQARKGLRPAPA